MGSWFTPKTAGNSAAHCTRTENSTTFWSFACGPLLQKSWKQ